MKIILGVLALTLASPAMAQTMSDLLLEQAQQQDQARMNYDIQQQAIAEQNYQLERQQQEMQYQTDRMNSEVRQLNERLDDIDANY